MTSPALTLPVEYPHMPSNDNRHARLLSGNLQYLAALEANGLDREAEALVGKIAVGLNRRRRCATPAAGAIELPSEERGRGDHDLQEFDRINARLARGYKRQGGKTADEQREADLGRRAELEGRAGLKRDQRERDAGIAETEALAQARGEEVSEDRSGVKRILDRDPLLSLARAGHITPEQLEVGQAVRELYDRRGEALGAVEYTGMPGSAHNHEAFIAKAHTRAKACEMIGRIERRITVYCSDEPACLTMLRAVCEQGMSVRSQGGGRAYDRNVAAIARALDAADPVLRRQA